MRAILPSPARRGGHAIALISFVLIVTFGLLALLFTQLTWEANSTREFRERLEQSVSRRTVLHRVFSSLQDAEIGARGFVLTGAPEFLEPYDNAVQRLPSQLKALLGTTARSPEHSNAMRVQEAVQGQLSLLARAIEARRETSPSGAALIALSRQEQEQMDDIRRIVEGMLQNENRQVEMNSLAVREQSVGFEQITLGLAIGLSLLVIGAAAAAILYVQHRHRSEAELKQARERAEDASKAKTDFLASMSHEIRTPLNSIVGYTDVLLDQELNQEQRRLLERIQFAGAALLTVVNDILDFSKIEAGQIALESHPFSITALIHNAVSIIAEAAQRKGLELTVEVDAGVPAAVIGDEARLRQVLLNLLNNAVKFTRQGGVFLRARCDDRDPKRTWICFTVADTGIGVPQNQHKNLFHRFHQLQHGFGGTGLGLAISKRLVNLMGGEIGLQSEKGKGSTFWFKVPLLRTEEDATSSVVGEASGKAGPSGRILLVEDLEHNRDLARMLLTSAGHQVDTAETGAEAVEAVQAKPYDLVLMDVQMPVMDGVTATKRIRDIDHAARDVPIVAMTANVLPQQVKAFGEAGMNDHVGKPFKKADLLRKVDTWLRRPKAPASAPITAGPDALRDLKELMGPEWVMSGLGKLQTQIDEAFADESAALGNRAELARRAHVLVSHAALLGFSELSDLCSRLEEACVIGGDVVPAFRDAKASADLVDRKVHETLALSTAGLGRSS